MTKCVVYIETQIRGQHSQRTYLNEHGSLGMHMPFWDEYEHSKRLFTLDSRCAIFKNQKEAETFVQNFVQRNAGIALIAGRDVIGYHGITEAGNPCAPFRKLGPKQPTKSELHAARTFLQTWSATMAAYDQLGMPISADVGHVTVGRDGDFDRDEVLGEIDYLLANMVDEELERAHRVLFSFLNFDWRCTAIDKYEGSAIVHFTLIDGDKTYHHSVQLVAFNLITAEDIAAMRASISQQFECEHA